MKKPTSLLPGDTSCQPIARRPRKELAIFFGLCVSLSACGGAPPEAESPAPPPAPIVTPPVESEEPEAALAEEPVQEDAEDSAPAGAQDIHDALVVVILDDALQGALNLTEPGRFPVKVAGQGVPAKLEVAIGEKPVEVIEVPADPKTEPVIVFTKIDVRADQGTIKYRYDIEGVRGTSYVIKSNEKWELKSSRLSQY